MVDSFTLLHACLSRHPAFGDEDRNTCPGFDFPGRDAFHADFCSRVARVTSSILEPAICSHMGDEVEGETAKATDDDERTEVLDDDDLWRAVDVLCESYECPFVGYMLFCLKLFFW